MNGLTLSRTCFGVLLPASTQFNRENSHAVAEASNWSAGNKKPQKGIWLRRLETSFGSNEASWINYRAAWYPSLTRRTQTPGICFVCLPGHTTNTASHLQDNTQGADSSETIKLMMTHTPFWWLVFSLEFVYVSFDDDKYIRVEKSLV